MAHHWKRGQTPDEEWQAFSERLNVLIDLEKVENEEKYYDELDKAFSTATSPLNRRYYSNLLENNSKVKKIIKEKQETLTLLAKAQRFERRRKRSSRLPDESRTSKRLIQRKNLTRGRYSKWRRNPSRQDIVGIDTRLKVKNLEKNTITTQDLALKKYKVMLDKRGIKSYRQLNGRFAHNPFVRR